MAVYTVDAALTASDPANNQFKTIQEAIDAARGADPQSEADRITIEIKASAVEYTGVNVAGMSNSVLNLKDAKFITLSGAGAGNTVFRGQINVGNSEGIIIENMTITADGTNSAEFSGNGLIDARQMGVKDLIIRNNVIMLENCDQASAVKYDVIDLYTQNGTKENVTISGNTISGGYYSIRLDRNNTGKTLVADNVISNSQRGVNVDGVTGSIEITGNCISNVLHKGIQIAGVVTESVTISENTVLITGKADDSAALVYHETLNSSSDFTVRDNALVVTNQGKPVVMENNAVVKPQQTNNYMQNADGTLVEGSAVSETSASEFLVSGDWSEISSGVVSYNGKFYTIGTNAFGSLNGASAALSGADVNIVLVGDKPILADAVDFKGNVTLSGNAVIQRNDKNILVGYGTGDGKLTIAEGSVLDFTNNGTETDGAGIIISDGRIENGITDRYHGELFIDNAHVKASYFFNRNIAVISGNGTEISDTANFSSNNGFYISSRPESETGNTDIAAVTINKKAFVDASGTNGVLIGYEGGGKLVVDDAKFVAANQLVTIYTGSSIELKKAEFVTTGMKNDGTVSIDGSSLNVKTVTNNGNISVTGNSKLNIESLTGNVNLVDGANISETVIGSGTVVTTGNVILSGNVTLDKFNAVDGEGEAGNSVTIAAGADVRLNGEVRIRTNDTVHIYGALTVGDSADFYKKNGSEMTIYKDGILTLEDSSFQNNSLLTVYGEMNLNYVNGWAPKLAGNETGKYSGQLVVDGKDGKGIVNVKTPFLTFGGGLGSAWKEAADGCTVDILNNGKIVTDAKAFWNSSKNTLTLNHGSLIFDAANSAYDSVWQADAKFDNDGVMSGSNSSVIDMSGRTFKNNGSVTLVDSTLSAGTLVNNSTVNVSGADSAVKAVFSGNGSTHFTDVVIDADWEVSGSQGEWRFLGNSKVESAVAFGSRVYAGTLQTADETDFSGVATSTLTISADFSAAALWIGAQYADGITDSKTSTVTVDSGSVLTVDGESSGLVIRESGILNVTDGSSLKIGHDRQVVIQGALTVDGAGSLFETASSPVNIYKDNAALTVSNGGKVVLGSYNDTNIRVGSGGEIVLKNGVLVLNDTLNINDAGSFSMDYLSTVSFAETINVAATASLTIDMTGFTGGVYKLMDYTGTGSYSKEQYKVLLGSNWNDACYSVIDSDLYLMNADMTTFKVDAAWSDSDFGAKVAEGYYYGFNAFSSVQDAADAVTAVVQTIDVVDAVYGTTKFTRSVNLSGTATFDLTKSESFMFFTDGVSAASYEITAGTVITAPSLSLRAEDASESHVDGLTVSVLCNGTVNLAGADTTDSTREIWVRKNTTLTVAEGGSVNGATQISNRGTININGKVTGVTIRGNGGMLLAGQKNSDGSFTGGIMNIDGGELLVEGVRTISGGTSLMITDKNATAASEKGIVNLTNGGKITAADSEMYIGLSGELNIGEAASVTVSGIENNGVINVTGSGLLNAAVAKGTLNFGTEQEKVNTVYDVTNQGASQVSVQNGEVTLTGTMADNVRIQPLNVGRYNTDYASGTLNIGSAADKTASVNAHQVYIAENESVNEHTLNVYGNLDVLTSIYNKAKGNLNVYGSVSADYLQVAGKAAVTGSGANLKLAGSGSNGAFKIGTDVAGLRGQMIISDHATVDAGGIAYVGYSDGTRVGDLMLSDNARLNAVAISIDAGSTISMDYTSTVAFETITNHGTITVDTKGFTSGVYKIFDDLTGSYTETEYRSLLGDANWNDYSYYKVIDNDLYLTNLEGAELYVDSAWASRNPNEEVTFADGTKAYYGLNAFDTVANALALPSGVTAYENAVKLNITGAVKSNISVIGSNITEVNSTAKTADENAVIAEDALTVNLIQVDNTEAGWEVYYPLAAGSSASVYGGITTNFVSGLFTFETTRDPNIIGGAYGASDAKIYGSTTVNIGTEGGQDSDVDIYVDALVGSGAGTVNGSSSVNIYSGTIERTGSIIGGSSWGGVVRGDSSVNIYGGNLIDSSDAQAKRGIMGGSYNGVTEGNASVKIYGGTVNGRIYAGGSQANTTVKGNASVNISGGVVNGNIYGTGGVVEGGISISVTGGTIKGNVYAGGLNIGVAGTKTVKISNYSNPDKDNKNHFYGGSSVTQSGTADALLEIVDGDVIMNVADTEAYADIFGGASVTNSDYVSVEAGSSDVTVKNLLINGYDSGKTIWTGRVYGAGQISNSGNSSVDNYDVYYQASSNVHVTNIGGITVNKDDGSVTHNPGARVYGGGYLYWSRKSEMTVGSTNVVVDEDLQKDSDVKTELAHVIGGSLISGTIDGVNASTIITGNTDVTVNAGVISAWLVGGNNSNWFGRSVIGVADENGAYEYNGEKYSAGSTKVTLNDGGSETLSIIGGSLTDYASYYEAGRLREAVVFGKTEIIMNGGTAYEAVGGGYALYQNQNADTSGKLTGVENPLSNVEGETNVTVNGGTIKSNVIGGGYAYSNQAASLSSIANVTGNTFVAIGGTAAVEGNVYGGGYADGGEADVTGNTSVNVTGGTVAGNIYGGGYHANVNGNATVTITGGTVSGDIYGSGEGEATVNGSRTLNLGSADAAAYAATLNNVYDFNVAQIVNADVTVTGDFSVEEITIAGATLTLNSGFLAATTAVAIEVGAYNVAAAALNVGVSGVNQPSITISAAEELTAGRYLVASGFDSLSGFTVDGINGYTLRLQGEDVYLTKDLAPDDYDANGRPDILMLHDIGKLQVGLVQEDQSVTLKDVADLGDGWTILGSGQSGNGENYADIYLTNGETVGIWQLDETTGVAAWQEIQSFDSATHVLGLGDFNGDGITDLLLQNDNGAVGAYHTSGENVGWNYFQSLGSEWSIAGIGDFNHDGIDDVVLQNEKGGYAGIWQLDRDGQVSWSDLDVLNNGQIAGTGDFNGDGFDDVLLKWGNSYGAWTVSGGNLSGWMDLGTLEDGTVLEQIGDFNGDGTDDLRVRSANGDLGAVCVLGEGNLQWNYHFSVGSEWQTNLVSI